jgi:CDP-diacylglycerol--glycerol-3-phosphate 3-phosphatidyltransferase
VTLANRITVFRLIMIPVFLVLVMSYTRDAQWMRHLALFIFVLAALSDAADGFVARAYNQKTRLGAVLDPMADKLMINLAFVFLAVNQEFRTPVPAWIPVIILSRDVIIVLGAYLIHEFYGPLRVRPRMSGKFNTVFQMSSIIVVLLEWRIAYPVLMVTIVISIISFVDYIISGYRQIGNQDDA